MAGDNELTIDKSTCTIGLSSSELAAGSEFTLTVQLTGDPIRDLCGHPVHVCDAKGETLVESAFELFDGTLNKTGEIALKAPVNPGEHVWQVVIPAGGDAPGAQPEISESFTFTVRPHRTSLVIWDVPTTCEVGGRFTAKIGIKCAAGCTLVGRTLEVHDEAGRKVGAATVGDAPWKGTAGLYYAEVEIEAPGDEGQMRYQASAPQLDPELPHQISAMGFGLRAVPAADCTVTVTAVNAETRAPLKGAAVVLHPYRAVTGEDGKAVLRVARGEYSAFVSCAKHVAVRTKLTIEGDLETTAPLEPDNEQEILHPEEAP